MKRRILFILVLVLLFSFYSKVSASELCFSNGYSIFTINGIFTDKNDAIKNKDKLKSKFRTTYNNEPLVVDYLYNPTHLAGVGDVLDAVAQGLFNQKSDYDLVEMLNDASQKVTTQKVLLVGHSQGNFYANSFYEKVASQPGGVPSQSIGVYGVASPADYVAGGGKYLTSDTDSVIASLIANFIKILSPNIHIALQNSDGNGHSFSDVYLKYQGDRVVSDIKSSLNKLQNNDEQESQDPCISPPKLSVVHKIQGAFFAVADPTANIVKSGMIGAYSVGVYIANAAYNTGTMLANAINILAGRNGAAVVLSSEQSNTAVDNTSDNNQTADIAQINKNTTTRQKETTTQTAEVVTATENFSNQNNNVEIATTAQPSENINLSITTKPGPDVAERAYYDKDTISPIITISGINPISIVKNNTYTDAGAGAIDAVDGVVSVVMTGSVDTSTIGTYTLTYTAADSSGNTATATRTVNVIENPDTTAPVITITGTNPIDVIKGTTYTDAGATANDAVDGVHTVNTTGSVDTSTIGVYTLTYTAVDSSGNTATATRTVNVVADTTAPVITILGNNTEVVMRNSVYTDAGATALDDVDGNLTSSIVKTGTFVNTAIAGTYTIIYTSTDLSGNSTIKTRTVVVDNGAMLNQPKFATVSGNHAYVASSSSNALEIIDISNPSVLVHKSSAVHRVNGFELFSPQAVAVSGNYAYVVSNSNALEIIDISNPVLPIHVGTLMNGVGGAQLVSPSSIAISGSYAYITAGGSTLIEIVNVSDPANPVHASSYFVGLLSPPLSVYISGGYAYVTFSAPAGSGFMQILDISNPVSPTLKGTINDGDGGASISNPQSVFVSGDYAYITSRGDNTLEIIDVSVLTAPTHKGKISNGAGGAVLSAPTSVFVSGSNAYVTSLVGDSLEILNVSDPTTPIHNGSLATNVGGSAIGSPQSVFVSGNYAYIASSSSNAFEIVDISDPTDPIHKNKIINGEASHTAP